MSSQINLAEVADPGAAASGKVRIYAKTDGKLYSRDDAGAEYCLSTASAGGIHPATAGGTGFGSYTVGDLLYADTTSALAKLAGGTDTYPLCANGAGVAPGYEQLQTGGIANDAVDDTKVGNRVPQFYRRQGGSATDWSSPGTTNRTPTTVRIQAGVDEATPSGSTASISITFPTTFSDVPTVLGLVRMATAGKNQDVAELRIGSISATGMNINAEREAGYDDLVTKVAVMWSVAGPE